jgi:AcrR family transcriptional regulator
MPRHADHGERRGHIVEALLRVAGERGLEAATLREVAREAGVSMGAVQHYFASTDEMLGYALEHWLSLAVDRRFRRRVVARLAGGSAARSGTIAATGTTAEAGAAARPAATAGAGPAATAGAGPAATAGAGHAATAGAGHVAAAAAGAVAATAGPAAILRAVAAEYLPHDEESRADTLVALAFLSRAAVRPALAEALQGAFDGFSGVLQELLAASGAPVDTRAEALRLAAVLDGLRFPVLIGALSYGDALAAVDRHLGQILAGGAPG